MVRENVLVDSAQLGRVRDIDGVPFSDVVVDSFAVGLLVEWVFLKAREETGKTILGVTLVALQSRFADPPGQCCFETHL